MDGLSRRRFLGTATAAGAAAASERLALSEVGQEAKPGHEGSVPKVELHVPLADPVRIKAVEAVRIDDRNFVRVTAESGDVGVVADNGRLLDLLSLFKRRIAPFFVGKDARDIVQLVDNVYPADSNYKFAGMPFWCCVAHIELAVLDLLGMLVEQPVGALFGKVLRTAIPVYLTRLTRDTTAEQEVAIVSEQLAKCGAAACKLKIGGRMKNEPQDAARTSALVPLARKTLEDGIRIYVDANGSYSDRDAIQVGRMLEDHGVGFFEEPCPWEEYEATKRVAEALKIPIAAGEQDTSWPRWRWMVAEKAVDLLQPDLYYNGGLIRCLRVAKLAESAGLKVTPHSPKTGDAALPMLHFASIVPNIGPHQEYAFSPEIVGGTVSVPTAPGLGIDLDARMAARAEVL